MQGTQTERAESTAPGAEVPFGSHEVRLSGRQWVVAGILILAALVLLPVLWERAETFEPEPDYRIPYILSNDYWLFSRYWRWAASQHETLVVGDSVIWAQYVSRDQTLVHCLNGLAGESRFANVAADGMHPAALAGLLRYYGRGISSRNVVVHCNPLWMSSKRHDLQVEKEFHFNHPQLVPQFVPSIPCYRESYSNRIGIAIERWLPFSAWTNHLRLAYFDRMDIPAWTVEHPYDNPLKAVRVGLPASQDSHQQEPVSWTERGLTKQEFPWVELDTAFQWCSFRRLVGILEARGNRVFVLVGPFNEHMLKGDSLDTYLEMKSQIAAWLRERGIAHYVAPALPSEYYADASHPLSEGYAMLAEQLFENEEFVRFRAQDRAGSLDGGSAR